MPQLTNHFFRVQWAVIRSLALEILLGGLSLNQRHVEVSCLDHSVEVLEIIIPGKILALFDTLGPCCLSCLTTVGKLND